MKLHQNLTLVFVGTQLFLSQSSRAQDSAIPLTLKQAYGKAMANNPSLKQSEENVNQIYTEVPLARALIMPELSATGVGEKKKDAINNSSGTSFGHNSYNLYQAGLHAIQPLFAYGAFSAIRAAKKDAKISQYNVDIASRDLGSSVIAAYYQVGLYARNVDALSRQEKIVSESLNTTQHRFHTGRSQLLDVLQVKTQIALLGSQLTDAKNLVDIGTATLSNLLGDPQSHAYAISADLEVPELAYIDSDVKGKTAYLPEIEANKLRISQIDDERSVTLGKNLPTLNLIGDYNYQSFHQDTLFRQNSNYWDVGLSLNIPIFTGLSGVYQRKALISQQIQLEDAQRSLENQENLKQVSSRKQLETAYSGLKTGVGALKLAEDSQKEAIRQYRLATIDFLQFLTVEQAYVQAEQALNNYKYNYVVALANYYTSLGQDISHLVDILGATHS